ncbi:MAG: DUF5615 family PIN-like protein [Beggiatoa sp.]|nr:DUF5615 family PIN-like protein [Beggiatoa sp.]
MPRFYADENFPLPVVAELRRLGHDVLTMVEADQAGQAVPDERVLAFASIEKRAVLTLNRRHFIRLHGVNAEHTGIVVCTFDPDFTDQAGRIHETVSALARLDGQLIRINRRVI